MARFIRSIPVDFAAYPDDSLLNSEDTFRGAQIQLSTDKPKERQKTKHPNRLISSAVTLCMAVMSTKKSQESISKLKAHSDDGTWPKTLRYDTRAIISQDKEFKQGIASSRKNSQQKYLGALIKIHCRRVERNKTKFYRIKRLQQSGASRSPPSWKGYRQ